MKLVFGLALVSLLVVCIGIQVYILLIVLVEIAFMGHTGVASAFGYGASLSMTVPAYLLAMVLIYGARMRVPARLIHASYWGSHLIIVGCMIALPGQFA